jgi:hypothetical protein
VWLRVQEGLQNVEEQVRSLMHGVDVDDNSSIDYNVRTQIFHTKTLLLYNLISHAQTNATHSLRQRSGLEKRIKSVYSTDLKYLLITTRRSSGGLSRPRVWPRVVFIICLSRV